MASSTEEEQSTAQDSGFEEANLAVSNLDQLQQPPPKRRKSSERAFDETFHPQGDLYLLVGEPAAEYRVSSQSLALASPFFKNLVSGPWAEQSQRDLASKWKIQLPEDDEQSLKLLLNIVHLNFSAVPTTLSTEDLFYVCVLADKYKLEHLLRPWAPRWTEHCRNELKEADVPSPLPWLDEDVLEHSDIHTDPLWIAWVLGDEELWNNVVANILWDGDFGGRDVFMGEDWDGNELNSVYVDSIGIIDDIEKFRLKCLKILYKPITEVYNTLNNGNIGDGCLLWNNAEDARANRIADHEMCHLYNCENLKRALWLPEDSQGRIPDAARNGLSLVDNMKWLQQVVPRPPLPGHQCCNLKSQIMAGLVNMDRARKIFLECARVKYKKRLEEQARLTGLD